jgi:hypothetical protein
MKTIYQLIQRGTFPQHCGFFATKELAEKREQELRARRAGIADGSFTYFLVEEMKIKNDMLATVEVEGMVTK